MSRLSISPSCLLMPGRALLRHGARTVETGLGEGWDGALSGLEHCLKQSAAVSGMSVWLSHHFAGLHLLPPPPVYLKAVEMAGWLQEGLVRDYGAEAETWRLAWQPAPPGHPVLATSMPAARYDSLQGLLAGHGIRPRSVSPWFVQAWLRHCRALAKATGWLALAEVPSPELPGRLVLGRLSRGRLTGLAQSRLDAGSLPDHVSDAVRRQALHLGIEAQGDAWILSPEGTGDWSRARDGLHFKTLPGHGAGWGGLLP